MTNLGTSSPALSGVVPESIIDFDKFRESLLGSWILFLEQDDRIKDVEFQPDGNTLKIVPNTPPDREEDFVLPNIVIHRLKENMKSGRIGDEFVRIYRSIEGEDKETKVYSKRFICQYQFDLLTRDLPSQFILSSYLDKKFHGIQNDDIIRSSEIVSFPLKNFGARIDYETDIPDTDVRVFWRPYKDLATTETASFNIEFEQLSYTLDFWVDFWYIEDNSVITEFETIYKNIDNPNLIY